ncbi:hypothetical protein M8J77_023563 [Diaphorina citri]|nr:hypothetical protein M8J77_023563 [Diaphorina citri]
MKKRRPKFGRVILVFILLIDNLMGSSALNSDEELENHSREIHSKQRNETDAQTKNETRISDKGTLNSNTDSVKDEQEIHMNTILSTEKATENNVISRNGRKLRKSKPKKLLSENEDTDNDVLELYSNDDNEIAPHNNASLNDDESSKNLNLTQKEVSADESIALTTGSSQIIDNEFGQGNNTKLDQQLKSNYHNLNEIILNLVEPNQSHNLQTNQSKFNPMNQLSIPVNQSNLIQSNSSDIVRIETKFTIKNRKTDQDSKNKVENEDQRYYLITDIEAEKGDAIKQVNEMVKQNTSNKVIIIDTSLLDYYQMHKVTNQTEPKPQNQIQQVHCKSRMKNKFKYVYFILLLLLICFCLIYGYLLHTEQSKKASHGKIQYKEKEKILTVNHETREHTTSCMSYTTLDEKSQRTGCSTSEHEKREPEGKYQYSKPIPSEKNKLLEYKWEGTNKYKSNACTKPEGKYQHSKPNPSEKNKLPEYKWEGTKSHACTKPEGKYQHSKPNPSEKNKLLEYKWEGTKSNACTKPEGKYQHSKPNPSEKNKLLEYKWEGTKSNTCTKPEGKYQHSKPNPSEKNKLLDYKWEGTNKYKSNASTKPVFFTTHTKKAKDILSPTCPKTREQRKKHKEDERSKLLRDLSEAVSGKVRTKYITWKPLPSAKQTQQRKKKSNKRPVKDDGPSEQEVQCVIYTDSSLSESYKKPIRYYHEH